MKKYLLWLSVVLATLFLSNCVSLLGGLQGSLYTDVVENATIINKDASEKEGLGTKTGEACATAYLGLVATGNAGIKAAAQKGNINNVRALDYKMNSILGSVLVTKCTIVHGD